MTGSENGSPVTPVSPLRRCARAVVAFVDRSKTKALAVAGAVGLTGAIAHAQTDATVIATNAQTAFATVAPITITIVGFYVILRIAKRVI